MHECSQGTRSPFVAPPQPHITLQPKNVNYFNQVVAPSPFSEASKCCKHLEVCFAPEEGVRSNWHRYQPAWGCAVTATLSSHCWCPTPGALLSWACSLCRSLGAQAAAPCAHRAPWQSQHVCWKQHSHPAGVAPFILTWQGKNSSSFLSWNGCPVSESRMGPAVLSLPGNANRWFPAFENQDEIQFYQLQLTAWGVQRQCSISTNIIDFFFLLNYICYTWH